MKISFTATFYYLSNPQFRYLYITGFILLLSGFYTAETQRMITTEAGTTHRFYSPKDGIPSYSPTNAFVTRNGNFRLSTTSGSVRISGKFESSDGTNLTYPDRKDGLPSLGQLTVRTKSDNGKVTIEIEDNGPGIPDDIKDKIMQPFFTTKKGAEGTGLGLSITNDIIKAHGGILEIDSCLKENSGSIFIIQLPAQNVTPESDG